MLPQILLIAGTLVSVALAAPHPSGPDTSAESTISPTTSLGSTVSMTSFESTNSTTATLSATVTFDTTITIVATILGATTTSSTGSSSYSKPTYTATEVYAFKPGSPFHLLPFQAKGQIFRLNDSPGVYCPSFVEQEGGCSMDSNTTGINGCSLSADVPGGQAIYLAPDGQLKYTQAHSQAVYPPNSTICPLTFSKVENSDATNVVPHGFGSNCFMACPMLDRTTNDIKQIWEVYANVPDMKPPLRLSNSSSCTHFEAVGIEKQLGHHAAAWQYI